MPQFFREHPCADLMNESVHLHERRTIYPGVRPAQEVSAMPTCCVADAHVKWWLLPGVCTLLKASVVCICCYLGSALDAAVVYPQINTAIFFPPYVIVTAALLFSPTRHWWIYLLASALGNYLPHRDGSPWSWVVMAEAAKFSRAVLAAAGMRHLGTDLPRFDTLRGVAAFLAFPVVIAPFVAAFVGAGVVVVHGEADEFWLVWQAWFLSNALTALTLLPPIVIGIRYAISRSWQPSWRRIPEASILLIGTLEVSLLAFAGPYDGPSSLPARLYAPLPFLLWAAVRFGPGWTSTLVLVITTLTVWGAVHEHGPFVTQAPSDNLLSMQLFLLAMSLPLMVLAALMAERQQEAIERKHAEAALRASNFENKELAGRLIAAQETERARIARQLHDDINQQLAAFSIALSNLKRRLPQAASGAQGDVASLQQQTIRLTEEIRNLSHELHPAVLQYAGLKTALKRSCDEFGILHGIDVTLRTEGNLEGVQAEIALCLYRVAQEALHNIAAHAHARRAQVALSRSSAELELTVSDDGRGFDPKKGRGLGLLSIDERVRLVRGRWRIRSRPQSGTQMHVCVPLRAEGTDDRALELDTVRSYVAEQETLHFADI
jgi:two-component system sensor histidine kinase UhpB